jgi:hypothetical protein
LIAVAFTTFLCSTTLQKTIERNCQHLHWVQSPIPVPPSISTTMAIFYCLFSYANNKPTLPTAGALHLLLHRHLLPHPSCPLVGCCAASCHTAASHLQVPLPLHLLCPAPLLLIVPLSLSAPLLFSGWLLVIARHCCPLPRPCCHHLGSSLTTKVTRRGCCHPYCCQSIVIIN